MCQYTVFFKHTNYKGLILYPINTKRHSVKWVTIRKSNHVIVFSYLLSSYFLFLQSCCSYGRLSLTNAIWERHDHIENGCWSLKFVRCLYFFPAKIPYILVFSTIAHKRVSSICSAFWYRSHSATRLLSLKRLFLLPDILDGVKLRF
jgi:hypothetical protein